MIARACPARFHELVKAKKIPQGTALEAMSIKSHIGYEQQQLGRRVCQGASLVLLLQKGVCLVQSHCKQIAEATRIGKALSWHGVLELAHSGQFFPL